MSDDPFQDPQWQTYADDVRRNLIPKIKDSAITMSLCTGGDPDPKLAIETGYMILLDKPIITVVTPGVKVPNKLAMVSDEIVEADLNDPDESSVRIRAAIERMEARPDRSGSNFRTDQLVTVAYRNGEELEIDRVEFDEGRIYVTVVAPDA